MASGKLATAVVEITAGFGDFGKALEHGVSNAITTQGAAMGALMENLGKELFKRFTIPFGIAAAANIAQWQGLERAMAETLTLFGTAPVLVDATFDEMSQGISEVSREVGGLESAIADGLYQTISAGVPREGAFEFLKVAQIAAITDKTADLTTAVDGITTAINAYGLEFSTADDVSDQFFATVARGKTTFGELSQSLGRVAPLAANAGTSLAETLAIVGQLTTSGLQTSEAVSFLRAGITGLLRPTDELNEIFQAVGFSTAEAAVPVIGLQQAFQTVVDAAGGSTSKLQELIGTSEGVSAILGVTGENAEKFASVLNSVENSAGATKNAFAIVDGTISRSFGKLTEAFDRIGNLFGSFGADFAQPVIDTFTGIVNVAADNFRKMAPIIKNVGEVFASAMDKLDTPVLRQIAGFVATLVIGFGGLLGILGAILFPLGKLIITLVKLQAVQTVFSHMRRSLDGLRLSIQYAGEAMAVWGKRMAVAHPAVSALGRTVQGLGKAMAASRLAMLGAAGAVGVLILAVGALVVWWSKVRDAQKAAFEAQQTYTIGTAKLAESVGATATELTLVVDATEDAVTSLQQFIINNANVIEQLKEIHSEFGALAARDFLLSIAADLSFKDIGSEDIKTILDNLVEGTGIELGVPITVNDIESTKNIETYLGNIGQTIEKFNKDIHPTQDIFSKFDKPKIEAFTDQLNQAFAAATQGGDQATFFKILIDEFENIDNIYLAQSAIIGLAQTIEDQLGRKLEFNLNDIKNAINPAEEFKNQLIALGETVPGLQAEIDKIDLDNLVPEGGDFFLEEPLSALDELGVAMRTQLPGIIELTDEQMGTLIELKGRMDEVLQAGTDFVTEYFDNMSTQITNQMPLLTTYEGAIDQTFAAWKTGSELFVEDLGLVDEARAKLITKFGEGSDLVDAFDQAPISEQAWLARLGPENFESALEQLLAQQTAVEDSIAARIGQDQNVIMEGVQTAMNAKYQELYGEAADAGLGVATLWQINFDRRASTWVDSAAHWMSLVRGMIGGTIDGPTVGGASFGPITGSRGGDSLQERYGDTTVNIYNPQTNDLSGDTARAGKIINTQNSYGSGHRR